MSFTGRDYQAELNLHNEWRKYASIENEERILSFLQESQWIPSQTTINRAITHLELQRTDGRTAKDDARAIRADAQRNYDAAARRADQLPLTRQELDEFSRLSQADLTRLYWGEDGKATDFFSVRYRKASREFGYRIPEKPAPAEVENDDDDAVALTAAEYHALPAQVVLQRMRNPKFKLAVMRLVKAGLIGLMIAGVIR
jgi:hypothetical protein